MNNSAFAPFGPSYLVGTSVVQVLTTNNNPATSYRIRNLLVTAQWFAWVQPVGSTSPTITVTAPTAGVPSANTMGLAAGATGIFGNIPPNAWFKADAAAAFEIVPGEGL
jgi:hypothetical protein